MEKLGIIVFGIILIIVGVLVGLNLFGITNINLFFDGWWTLFIIIPSIITIINGKHKIDGVVGLIVGLILLILCQNIVSYEVVIKLSIPLCMIGIGIDILIKNLYKKNKK